MSQSVATISKTILTDRNTNYGADDVIEIYISPEEVPLLNARQGTFISWDLRIDETSNCLVNPDPMAGGYSVIQSVSIYSNGGQLLEQLDNMAEWTALYYHYNKNSGLMNSRNLTEGRSPIVGRSLRSQYFTQNAPTSAPTTTPVECILPLYQSGLFAPGSKILPVLLLNGCRIRIQLKSNKQALRALTEVGYSSSPNSYVGIKETNSLPVAGDQIAQTFILAGSNIGDAIPYVPIAVGSVLTRISLYTAGVDVVAIVGTGRIPAIAGNVNCPWQIGQELWIEAGATPTPGNPLGSINCGPILAFDVTAGRVGFTFAATAATTVAIPPDSKVWVNANSLTASYTVSNVGMTCSVVQAPPERLRTLLSKMSSSGGVRLDYTSFNLYRQNLNAKIPQTELLIPTVENRAMSIVVAPMRTTSQLYEDTLQPIGDQATSYQFNLGNRLVPNRRVEVDRVMSENAVQTLKWNGIHLHETEKAMARLKIPPRNLTENARACTFPRALSKEGHSYNANRNEVRLNIQYGQGANDNVLNKLTNGWVHHIRTAVITPGQVAVEF